MKMLLFAFAMALQLVCAAQQNKKTKQAKPAYKIYHNSRYHFSFGIPVGWKITSNGDGIDYTCYPVSRAQKEQYKDYGLVFSLQVIPASLDSTAAIYFSADSGEYYYSPPMDNDKKVDRIKGSGFTGLHEIHACRVSMDITDLSQTTVVDGCEQIFLSNGKITLFIMTSGIALEDEDFKELIQTLHFL